MKWLIRVVLGLAAVVLVLVGVGFLLPSQFHVKCSVVIDAAAERVYSLIAGPREWKRWSVWN
jgi:hypothetical protein